MLDKQQPKNFIGGGKYSSPPPQQPARVVDTTSLAQGVILCKVYATGETHLTAAAANQYRFGETAELVPPTKAGQPWFLDLRPEARNPLSKQDAKSMWQFRCGYRLGSFFPVTKRERFIKFVRANIPQTHPLYIPLSPI
jgi:hypothetical protein